VHFVERHAPFTKPRDELAQGSHASCQLLDLLLTSGRFHLQDTIDLLEVLLNPSVADDEIEQLPRRYPVHTFVRVKFPMVAPQAVEDLL
jgi:hypothetical protein